jgi:hypothetical protein
MTVNVKSSAPAGAGSAPAETSGSQAMTGAQKAETFEAWARSFPADMPVLSLEDVSREKIYQRD